MSNITEIASVFKIASNSFDPIRLKPNDDGLHQLNEVLVSTTLSATPTGTGSGTANGLVLTGAVYKTNKGGRDFDFMRAAPEHYDPDIARLGKDDRISKMRVMEHVWKVWEENQIRIYAVEVGARNLIIDNVETT